MAGGVITGVVMEASADGKRIRVDGNWYSSYLPSNVNGAAAGDLVTFSWKESEKVGPSGRPYLNIVGKVAKMGGATSTVGAPALPAALPAPSYSPPEEVGKPVLCRDRCIIRQNAMTSAIALYTAVFRDGNVYHFDNVLDLARKIEAYTSGDMEVEQAKKDLGME